MVSEIWTFLEANGISLASSGSSERALNREDASRFLDLLHVNNMEPKGIEVWTLRENGTLKIDSLAGWAASPLGSADDIREEAQEVLFSSNEKSYFTIQF